MCTTSCDIDSAIANAKSNIICGVIILHSRVRSRIVVGVGDAPGRSPVFGNQSRMVKPGGETKFWVSGMEFQLADADNL